LQYKNHLSGFKDWDQISHADEWMLFPDNIGKRLSIDEVALSNGELFTIVTNKQAKGGKGAIVAMAHGTKSSEIQPILNKVSEEKRMTVEEITMDMANYMDIITGGSFPKAVQVIDRFHAQKIVSDAVQEIRIELRKRAIKEENEALKQARAEHRRYRLIEFKNGDTKKQLLARSRYLLFKARSKWTDNQRRRADILFEEFPEIKNAYDLSMMFRSFYEHNSNQSDAKTFLNKWYEKIREKNIESFNIAAETIYLHEATILNYFNNRSTNASAESFNAKLKAFRSIVRGVRDLKFHLFRVAKLYA
jgi:transposase